MAIELNEKRGGKLLEVHVSGKLTTEDYDRFIPAVEKLIKQHGKIDILFEMSDFHGWEAGAMWEDTKFAFRHFSDLGRLAVVGEKKWQEWMLVACRPFTKAAIRYFDHANAGEALAWLEAD
jgi:hypothetical protein